MVPHRLRIGGVMPTILLIEDDPSVCSVIAQHLSDAGFAVSVQPDTTTALQHLDAVDGADLLLVDLVMPADQIDGLAFAEIAKARRPQLPIIFMTGYYGFVARAGELPGSVIFKPVDLDELTRAVTRAL